MVRRSHASARKASLITLASLIFAITTASVGAYTRPGRSVQVDAVPRKPAPSKTAQNTSLSATGRYIAFDTESKLLGTDDNGQSDVYLRDMKTNRLWLASHGYRGDAARGLPSLTTIQGRADWSEPLSWDPTISGDGRYVAYVSRAFNLVEGDNNVAADIFLYDRVSDAVQRVSLDSEGHPTEPARGDVQPPEAWAPSIDNHGRRVTFTTVAALVEKDTNLSADVYVHDRKTGRSKPVSIGLGGAPASAGCLELIESEELLPCLDLPSNSLSDSSSISSNGRFVAFESFAGNLVKRDTNGVTDAFVRDLGKGRTERVSVTSDERQVGEQGPSVVRAAGWFLESNSFDRVEHAISSNGRFVVFSSHADNLVPQDQEQSFDLGLDDADYFVRDRKLGRTERVSVTSTGSEVDNWIDGSIEVASISADGRFVAFPAHLRDPAAPKGSPDGSAIFVYDRVSGSLEIASRETGGRIGIGCRIAATPPSDPGWSSAEAPDISSDGRFVSFNTCSKTMYEYKDDDIDNEHVLVRDRGRVVGTGGFGRGGSTKPPPDDDICVASFCLPPGPGGVKNDLPDEASISRATDLLSGRFVHRSLLNDIYFVEEISRLEMTGVDRTEVSSPILYGIRFQVEGRRYEVRAVSHLGGTFGLFECARGDLCRKISDLEGGYGTTGERIVVALPLDEVGATSPDQVSDVRAFSAYGSYLLGSNRIVDAIRLD